MRPRWLCWGLCHPLSCRSCKNSRNGVKIHRMPENVESVDFLKGRISYGGTVSCLKFTTGSADLGSLLWRYGLLSFLDCGVEDQPAAGSSGHSVFTKSHHWASVDLLCLCRVHKTSFWEKPRWWMWFLWRRHFFDSRHQLFLSLQGCSFSVILPQCERQGLRT